MYLGIPQFIYIALVLIGLGSDFAKDGESKTGYYDFWNSLSSQLIIIVILAFGGFFSK